MANIRSLLGSARMLRAARFPAHTTGPPHVWTSSVSYTLASSSNFSTSAAVNGPWTYTRQPSKPLNRYLVIADDFPDPGALARRLEVRERHLEGAAEGIESGIVELGGGYLKRDFDEVDEEVGPASSIIGSLMIVFGESIADVRSRVMQDEYVQAGVWDPSKLRILPFLRAAVASASESQATGHPAVGKLKPVGRRAPKSESKVKRSIHSRDEVYVQDPRNSGLGIRQRDHQSFEEKEDTTKASLGDLRSQQNKKAPKNVTLGSLREDTDKTPPAY